jgi:hypothetical protein
MTASDCGRLVCVGSRLTWERGADPRDWSDLPMAIRLAVTQAYYTEIRDRQQKKYHEEAAAVLAMPNKTQRRAHMDAYRLNQGEGAFRLLDGEVQRQWAAGREARIVQAQIELAG